MHIWALFNSHQTKNGLRKKKLANLDCHPFTPKGRSNAFSSWHPQYILTCQLTVQQTISHYKKAVKNISTWSSTCPDSGSHGSYNQKPWSHKRHDCFQCCSNYWGWCCSTYGLVAWSGTSLQHFQYDISACCSLPDKERVWTKMASTSMVG